MTQQPIVRACIGIIIENPQGRILIGKRIGSHAPYYSIPGGSIEIGETFEQTATREAKEETGLDLCNPRVVACTNNLRTLKEGGPHHVSIILHCNNFVGEPKNMEPKKCEGWMWVDPRALPQPHFDASEQGVRCFLENKICGQS